MSGSGGSAAPRYMMLLAWRGGPVRRSQVACGVFGRQPENSMSPDWLRRWTIPALMSTVVAVSASATDLRITDARGAEVVVTGATIDYGGLVAADKMTDGIRVLQG